MKVLIVKTTSMGDVIHTLPALQDARQACSEVVFDWVVEAPFRDIPRFSPAVDKIIPVVFRQWRGTPFAKSTREAYRDFKRAVRAKEYDLIIDAQGLCKSAWLASHAFGQRWGFSYQCVREPLASLLYHRTATVDKQQHAIERVRDLFAAALDYVKPDTLPNAGLVSQRLTEEKPYLMFFHATTWKSKHWHQAHWRKLVALFEGEPFNILLPWGNPEEENRAQQIAKGYAHAHVMDRVSIAKLAEKIAMASGIVAVDTGLGHLGAAFNIPAVSLYGPTDPKLTGALGRNQFHFSATQSCAPCFETTCRLNRHAETAICMQSLTPERVHEQLLKTMQQRETP